MSGQPLVLVLGASGQIGHFLLPRLLDAGLEVLAVSRGAPAFSRERLTWIQHDLATGPAPVQAGILISAGPLELAFRQAEALPRLGRVIAFSSASVRFKRNSPDPDEAALLEGLARSEQRLEALCKARGIDMTLFRPTLIYGGPGNANVEAVRALIDKRRFVPVAGNGRRQPVHADDLARVTVTALERGAAAAGVWELGGGEVLGYRDFVRRIGGATPPRLVSLPAGLLRTALRAAHRLGRLSHLRPVMIDRQRADLVVDDTPARQALDWNPRPFRP